MNAGRTVIVTMLLVGASLSGFAWWARYSRSRIVLENLGAEAVIAIRRGDRVELLRLGESKSGNDAHETLTIEQADLGPQTLTVTGNTDITRAPGLIHAQHHLAHELAYAWDEERPAEYTPGWQYALRFTRDGDVTTMLLDLDQRRSFLVEQRKEIGIQPVLSDALSKFFASVEPPASG